MFWHHCLLFVYPAASTFDSSPSASYWLQIQPVVATHTHLTYVIAPATADSTLAPVPPLIPIEPGVEVLNSYPVVPVSIKLITVPITGAGNSTMWLASLSAFINAVAVCCGILALPLPLSVAVIVTGFDCIPTLETILPLAIICRGCC